MNTSQMDSIILAYPFSYEWLTFSSRNEFNFLLFNFEVEQGSCCSLTARLKEIVNDTSSCSFGFDRNRDKVK